MQMINSVSKIYSFYVKEGVRQVCVVAPTYKFLISQPWYRITTLKFSYANQRLFGFIIIQNSHEVMYSLGVIMDQGSIILARCTGNNTDG